MLWLLEKQSSYLKFIMYDLGFKPRELFFSLKLINPISNISGLYV